MVVPGGSLMQRCLQALWKFKGLILSFTPAWNRVGIVMTRAFVVCVQKGEIEFDGFGGN